MMQRVANDYELAVTLWRRYSLTSMALEMVAECDSALRIRMHMCCSTQFLDYEQ